MLSPIFVAIIIKFVILSSLEECRADDLMCDPSDPLNDPIETIGLTSSSTVHKLCGMTTVSFFCLFPNNLFQAANKV